MFYIAYFLEAGLLLVVLPWSSFWDRNFFVEHWPALRPWMVNDFVRGAVSGLGMVNLAAGIADLVPVVLARDPHDAAVTLSAAADAGLAGHRADVDAGLAGHRADVDGLARRSAEREGGA